VRRYDNDRFICSLFAPAAEREALWSIYAFNLEVARIRELVTQPLLGHVRLRWWVDALDAIYDRRAPNHPVALALGETIQRYRVDRRHLDKVIAGRAFDLEDSAPASLAELVDYADATSAAVSSAALDVLGEGHFAMREAARDVAVAWALIGLVRAVPFHARFRRTYLPADLNREAGLDIFALFESGPVPGLREVAKHLLETAGEHLRHARAHREDVTTAALPVLLPATLADLYLARLATAGYDPFDPELRRPLPLRIVRVAFSHWRRRY
jgi:phytoene synthase